MVVNVVKDIPSREQSHIPPGERKIINSKVPLKGEMLIPRSIFMDKFRHTSSTTNVQNWIFFGGEDFLGNIFWVMSLH